MTRQENSEAVAQLFDRLHTEFGRLAPAIIRVLVESVGGCRLTFPDLNDLYRAERNRRIRIEFIGNNYEELAIKYGVGVRTVRKVLLG
jgi:Mor family transcriptional regulator